MCVCAETLFTFETIEHFLSYSKHKWMTITGNGTFLSPGIIIIDWKVLNDPSSRLTHFIDDKRRTDTIDNNYPLTISRTQSFGIHSNRNRL